MQTSRATPEPSARERARRLLVLGLASLALVACAARRHQGQNAQGPAPGSVVLRLNNDLSPPADVTVYAVSQGDRRVVGSVPPGGERVLQFRLPIPGTVFRLVARLADGRELRSDPITLGSEGLTVAWELQMNSMWFPTEGP